MWVEPGSPGWAELQLVGPAGFRQHVVRPRNIVDQYPTSDRHRIAGPSIKLLPTYRICQCCTVPVSYLEVCFLIDREDKHIPAKYETRREEMKRGKNVAE